jgi:two-component system, OmpR family, copper resistance phosphate regulon response regulator CusR
MKILVVEDETKLADFIRKGLEEFGYEVEVAYDGLIGSSMATSNIYDLLLLDVNLPKFNGFEVIKKVRDAGLTVPIILLTAMGGIQYKEEGFESGANDYLVKPFEFKELILRIKNQLQHKNSQKNDRKLIVHDLVLDLDLRMAIRQGKEISLTSKEYDLLKYLIMNKGRVISRIELSQNVWGNDFDTGTNTIDVYVNFLRKKIENDFEQKLIHTIVGMGYMLRTP